MMPRRGDPMNLMTAYAKTLSNDGVIAQLWDYLNDLGALDDAPYLGDNTKARALDNYYYYSWSGDKLISPMIYKLWDYENDLFPTERMQQVVEWFWSVNKDILLRLWNDFKAQYDAVNNYHVEETTDYGHQGTSSYVDSGSDTRKKYGTIESYGKTKTTDKVYGFDSDGAVNDSESETEIQQATPMTTDYGTANDALTDETQYGRGRQGADSALDNLTTTKEGNLGIMPVADFLQKEFELWEWNFYKNCLFKLLDSMLTIPIY